MTPDEYDQIVDAGRGHLVTPEMIHPSWLDVEEDE